VPKTVVREFEKLIDVAFNKPLRRLIEELEKAIGPDAPDLL